MATLARAPFWIVDPLVVGAGAALSESRDAMTLLAMILFTSRHCVDDPPEPTELRVVHGGRLVAKLTGDTALRCLLADSTGERWRA